MRPGSVRHGLNLPYIQNSKVRLPLMKPVQRVVIGAEIFRQTCTSYRLLEHPAERQAIDDSALDPESDDSACVLVHDNQHPICLQGHRFTAEQVEAPQTVLHMTDERQPRGTAFYRLVRVMYGARIRRTTSLLIDVPKAKLICSAICGHPHDGLRRFISTTARIKSAVGPFGPGFIRCFRENNNRYLRCTMAR